MADVIGPSHYLPGQLYPCGKGHTCDNCADEGKDVVASYAVVGETDSFGSEIYHMCDEHYKAHQEMAKANAKKASRCEHCGKMEVLKPFRDPEEGTTGPVYQLCFRCRKALVDHFVDDDDS